MAGISAFRPSQWPARRWLPLLLSVSCQILLLISITQTSAASSAHAVPITTFSTQPASRLQPIRCSGLPIPIQAEIIRPEQLSVTTLHGQPVPFSVEPLMRWGAVPLTSAQAPLRFVRLCVQPPSQEQQPHFQLHMALTREQTREPRREQTSQPPLEPGALDLLERVRWSSLTATNAQGRALRILPGVRRLVAAGPLEQRLVLEALATFDPTAGPEHVEPAALPIPALAHAAKVQSLRRWPLQLSLVVRSLRGSPGLQLSLTVRNRQPAGHPGNVWELGAAGALYFRTLSWGVVAGPGERFLLSPKSVEERQSTKRLELLQATASAQLTGALRHRDARGQLPAFAGYRLLTDRGVETGSSAEPVAALEVGPLRHLLVPEQFWQFFPKGITLSQEQGLRLELLPDLGDPVPQLHELQGGEQLTYRWWQATESTHLQFAPALWREPGADPSFRLSPRYWVETRAGFTPDTALEQDIQTGIEGTLRSAFFPTGSNPRTLMQVAMQHEAVGWRDFGELQADHETRCGRSAYDDPSFVSNYNHQYDPVWGAWRQCGRRGSSEICSMALQMARHLADIDVYHTTGDRAVYNGGQFWHTTHDTPAGLSSHRAYPRLSQSVPCTRFTSGGPGLGQLYLEGLVQGWLWSGELSLKDAAEELGKFMHTRWRIDPDDREPRASANVLRSATTLCAWQGLPSDCQLAEQVVREGPKTFAKTPTWQEAMYGQALGYWLELARERRKLGLHLPDPEVVRLAQQRLGQLCQPLTQHAQQLPLTVDLARYADVLAFGIEMGVCTSNVLEALQQLWRRLERDYWASGTYPNAKELSILLSSGGSARHWLQHTRE